MLKGKTTIELTNVKTGEVEIYEDENLVTNAIQDLYTINPRFFHYHTGSYDFQYCGLIPIIPNTIGGILLFNDPILENPDVYYAKDTNKIIGYSNNTVNTNADALRGSTNVTETKRLDNGYKFVFDFSTSQGNGLISSIGLTSTWGGQGYCGNTYNYNDLQTVRSSYSTSWGERNQTMPAIYRAVMHLVYFKQDDDTFISAECIDTNTIQITKMKAKILTWDPLCDNTGFRSTDNVETLMTINTTIFGSNVNKTSSSSYRYHNFLYDNTNNILWGFEHTSNSSGDCTINYIKINVNDLTWEEQTITLPIQIVSAGYMNALYYQTATQTVKYKYGIIKDGYYYIPNQKLTGIYKIDLNNFNNYKLISSPTTITLFNGEYSEGSSYDYSSYATHTTFNQNGDILYFDKGYIINDIIYARTANDEGLKKCSAPQLSYGPFLFTPYCYWNYNKNSGDSETYTVDYMLLMTPYLATINNLETPIEKTSDKTMKITYILTEVNENSEE